MDALWVGVDTYRNTLQKTDIKADLVPLDRGTWKREAQKMSERGSEMRDEARVDAVVHSPTILTKGRATWVCHSCGDCEQEQPRHKL